MGQEEQAINPVKATALLVANGLAQWRAEQPTPPGGRAILRRAFELAHDRSFAWMIESNDDRFKIGLAAAFEYLTDRELQALRDEVTVARWITEAGELAVADTEARVTLPAREAIDRLKEFSLYVTQTFREVHRGART